MFQWVYINSEFVKEEDARLHYRDLAIQRGYGVFDFFKIVTNQPVFLDDYLDRFFFSSGHMRLHFHLTRSELKDIIYTLIQKNGVTDCGMRLTLTGGYSPDGYQLASPNLIISQHTIQPPSQEQYKKGIKLITYAHQRQLPEVKTIDYLIAIWLQPKVKSAAADDILYYKDNLVSECPRSNFFIVTKDEKVVTPSCNILKGITRKKVLETARQHFDIEERDISLEDIKQAKEAFITSTTKMILPVAQIDDQIFSEGMTITTKLQELLVQFQEGKLV
jgi:D-alanine transaminase/branched-chain amino acid aminotransferase